MTAQGTSSTGSHWAGRPWQALHSLSDRTPLRTKLITALLALVALALPTRRVLRARPVEAIGLGE